MRQVISNRDFQAMVYAAASGEEVVLPDQGVFFEAETSHLLMQTKLWYKCIDVPEVRSYAMISYLENFFRLHKTDMQALKSAMKYYYKGQPIPSGNLGFFGRDTEEKLQNCQIVGLIVNTGTKGAACFLPGGLERLQEIPVTDYSCN